MQYKEHFDVIVVGGGHAGTEAALAAARIGANTLLLTHSVETIGQMSCNPAIGGIGKGHLVKEIDALGGVMAKAADLAGIQFRILNSSKGPAVRATRAQADRALYKQAIRGFVEASPRLKVFQQAVDDLIITNDRVTGVTTQGGINFYANCVVVTAGTFLGGVIHVGLKQSSGGRAGDAASITLANKLRDLPFTVGRLKTGTPPRLDGRTIDFTKLTAQPGDNPLPVFSFTGKVSDHPKQVNCYITYTNATTHQIIADNIDKSPMYCGVISGVGPRYCPSIEDKIVRFKERDKHQIFLEPEGLTVHEYYPNGISTSLPFAVQLDFVRSMVGLENVHITRPGYAIEYDYFDPRDLNNTLESKLISNLFFAGQINGTTGYEEAAAQGLVAGCNAALKSLDRQLWQPSREESYIGVMIDDLITKGITEPYRMFTSRSEYRLSLREDNADLRLSSLGRNLGLIDEARYQMVASKEEKVTSGLAQLKTTKGYELLKRPEYSYEQLVAENIAPCIEDKEVVAQIEISIKYAGYISRQQDEIDKVARFAAVIIPNSFDYSKVVGMSTEVREKLIKHRPNNLQEASKISGVTPASISLLLVALKRYGYIRNTAKELLSES